MAKKHHVQISGLKEYGLSPEQLATLGTLRVDLEIIMPVSPYIYPTASMYEKLRRLTPQERRQLQGEWSQNTFQQLCAEVAVPTYDLLTFDQGNPYGMRLAIEAQHCPRLLQLRHAESVHILRIAGRKRAKQPSTFRYYAVQARFAWQHEGQTKGMQWVEERIVAVKARSVQEATTRAMQEFRRYETPSLSSDGHFFRMGFESLLHVYDMMEWPLQPQGSEIYAELRQRRMKPAYEWHPSRDDITAV
jgi:hypothetical protein